MTAVDWAKIILPVLTAILAAFLALVANGYLDKRKASRDLLGQVADGLREDVKRAIEIASAYWSDPTKDKLLNESKLKMLEQEIRSASVLLDDGKAVGHSIEFQSAVTSFLSVLTGADFEAKSVTPNQAHVRDVVGRGVALRKITAQLRRNQVDRKSPRN